jgi:hypothetical protein
MTPAEKAVIAEAVKWYTEWQAEGNVKLYEAIARLLLERKGAKK